MKEYDEEVEKLADKYKAGTVLLFKVIDPKTPEIDFHVQTKKDAERFLHLLPDALRNLAAAMEAEMEQEKLSNN